MLGGSQNNEGRVQVYYNGRWGSVCNHQWDFYDARVACRQLGFVDVLITITDNRYGDREQEEDEVLDYVQCSGNEPGLQFCDNNGFGNQDCSVSEMAGVVCTGKITYYYSTNHLHYECNTSTCIGMGICSGLGICPNLSYICG